MRRCIQCKLWKPIAEFWPKARRCTECVGKSRRFWPVIDRSGLPVHNGERWIANKPQGR